MDALVIFKAYMHKVIQMFGRGRQMSQGSCTSFVIADGGVTTSSYYISPHMFITCTFTRDLRDSRHICLCMKGYWEMINSFSTERNEFMMSRKKSIFMQLLESPIPPLIAAALRMIICNRLAPHFDNQGQGIKTAFLRPLTMI